MGTSASSEDSDEIRVYIVCKDKIDVQSKKYSINLETITCEPPIYMMDHPDFIQRSFMKNSIGLKRVNMLKFWF